MISEMRAFVLLAETGSIQLTAERLPLTQPAVTRQIQRLEAELGTKLLDRRVKPPRLTPAGLVALEQCRAILGAIGDLKASASASEPEGVLRVGTATALASDVVAEAVQMVRNRFPKVALRLAGGWAHDLREAVQRGRLDAAVVLSATGLPARSEGLRQQPIARETMVVVAGRQAALGRAPDLAALAERDWVVSPLPCDARHVLEAALAGVGGTTRIAAEIQGIDLQSALIGQGLGLGLVPARRLPPYARQYRLKTVTPSGTRFDFEISMIRAPHLGRLDIVLDALRAHLGARLDDAGTVPPAPG
jgi:DNA-binding transcriptional LysR family regulator